MSKIHDCGIQYTVRTRRNAGWIGLAGQVGVVLALAATHTWGQAQPGLGAAPKPTTRPATKTQPSPPLVPATSPAQDQPESAIRTKPKLKCDTPEHDFGEVWAGTVCKHAFEVVNIGTTPLEITNVRPSCGCTLAGKYDKEIGPGVVGKIPLSINTDRFKGPFSKTVTVTTNDPTQPNLTLKLKGTVKPLVNVEPASANFSTLKEDEVKSIAVKLTNNTETPLTLTVSQQHPAPPFGAELQEVTPGKEYLLTITARPPYRQDWNRSEIVLDTNLSNLKQIKVGCVAQVPPRLTVQPRSVTLPPPQADGYTRQITVNNNGSEPVTVLAVEASLPGVESTITEHTKGKSYEITLRFPPGFALPSDTAEVVLKTDDAKMPTLSVALRLQKLPPDRRTASSQPADTVGLVGKPAPGFSLQTLAGAAVTREAVTGHVVLLGFLDDWGDSAKPLLQHVQQIGQGYKDKGVTVIGISKEDGPGPAPDTPEQLRELRDNLGLTFDLAMDPANKVNGSFKVAASPTWVLLGTTGTVEAVHAGTLPSDFDGVLRREIDTLLSGESLAARAATQPAATGPRRKVDRRRPPGQQGPIPVGEPHQARPGRRATTQEAKSEHGAPSTQPHQ